MTVHHELLVFGAGFIAGALDRRDRRRLLAHVSRCADCAAELRAMGGVTLAIARGAAEVTPEPVTSLRSRVLEAASCATPRGTRRATGHGRAW